MNYPAKSCARILTQDQPGPQDSHGCPFRHFSTTSLSSAMVQHYGLNQSEQSEILASVKQGHYHVACTRIFEITHQRQESRRAEDSTVEARLSRIQQVLREQLEAGAGRWQCGRQR